MGFVFVLWTLDTTKEIGMYLTIQTFLLDYKALIWLLAVLVYLGRARVNEHLGKK